MNKQIALQEIIDFLGSDVIQVFGNPKDVYVRHLKPSETVDKDTLDWVNSIRPDKQVIAENSKAKVILADKDVQYTNPIASQCKTLILVENPRITLALIADQFFVQKPSSGIHFSSYIHPKAEIFASAYIGSNCSIGKCTIGENTRVYPNVTIYDGVNIGNNVIIQAGTVVGTDGLGCDRKKNGELVKFPHLGGVEICDNVEIGANCHIARGALSNTIIGSGSKINGLCFIAHNCILGKNVWITGDTMLAGSVSVEDNVTIYSKVIIREQRKIGEGSIIGMGAVVTKDVPPCEIWIGNPAKKMEK